MNLYIPILLSCLLLKSSLASIDTIDELSLLNNDFDSKVAYKAIRVNRKLNKIVAIEQKPIELPDFIKSLKKICHKRNIKLLSVNQNYNIAKASLAMPSNEKLHLRVLKNEQNFQVQLKSSADKTKRRLQLNAEPFMLRDFSKFVRHYIKQVSNTIRNLEDNPIVVSRQPYLERVKSYIEQGLKRESDSNPNIKIVKVDQHYEVLIHDNVAFDIFLKANEADMVLTVTNVPKDAKFSIFDSNHFEFRRLHDENDTNLESFADNVCKHIWPKISHLDSATNFNADVVLFLSSILPDYDIMVEKLVKLDKDLYVTLELYRKGDTDRKILEFHIQAIVPNELYKINLAENETTFEIELSPENLNEQLNKVKDDIINIVKKADETLFYLPKIIEEFNKEMSSRNNSCTFTKNDSENIKFNYALYEIADNSSCVLEKTQITLSLYHYGYNRYFHIVFENDFLLQEFAITVNHNFITNLKKALNRVYDEVETQIKIRKSQKNPTEVNMNDVKSTLEKLAKDYKYTCSQYSTGYTCTKTTKYGEETVLMVRELNSRKQGKFLKVNFINPLMENASKQENFAHSEIIINEKNGSSQLVKMQSKAKTFFDTINKKAL